MMRRMLQKRSSCLAWSVGMLLLAMAGCSIADRQPATPEPVQDLPILWQKSGTYSRLMRTTRVLARDPGTLAQLPIAEVPVDWKTQMVLIVGLGPTPTNELGVRVARVWQQGSVIHVQERRIHPGAERSPSTTPGSPWTIAVIPRNDLNVEGFDVQVPRGALGENPGAR